MDLSGAAAASLESVEDASGGSGIDTVSSTTGVGFKRFRRRCGSSFSVVNVSLFAAPKGGPFQASFSLASDGSRSIEASDLLDLLERIALAQKNLLSISPSLANAICCFLTGPENGLRADWLCCKSLFAHRLHTLVLLKGGHTADVHNRNDIEQNHRRLELLLKISRLLGDSMMMSYDYG